MAMDMAMEMAMKLPEAPAAGRGFEMREAAGALVGDLKHRPEARERCGSARPRGPGGEVEIEVEVHARACPRR